MGARRNPPASRPAPRRRPAWLNGRLLGGLVLFVGLGGLLLGAIWQLAQVDTLPIRHVQVEGEFRHLSTAALHAALAGPASGGFFNVDVRAVKQAAEALPWVDRASVRRVWPDTLRVHVVEQQPLARWRDGSSDTALVNPRGELFSPAPTTVAELTALPLFFAPEASAAPQLVARYARLRDNLAALGLGLRELGFDRRRAWRLTLDNGVQLLLGRVADDAVLRRFTLAWPQALAAHAAQIERIDLRYTNGFAVRWKAGTAPTGKGKTSESTNRAGQGRNA